MRDMNQNSYSEDEKLNGTSVKDENISGDEFDSDSDSFDSSEFDSDSQDNFSGYEEYDEDDLTYEDGNESQSDLSVNLASEKYPDDIEDDHDWEIKHALALKKWGHSSDSESEKKQIKVREAKKVTIEKMQDTNNEPIEKLTRNELFENELAKMDETAILNYLQELINSKTKRTTSRTELLQQLQMIYDHCVKSNFTRIEIESIRQIIHFQTEYMGSNISINSIFLQCVHYIEELVKLLIRNSVREFIIGEASVNSTIVSYLDRIDAILYRILQGFDTPTTEYHETLVHIDNINRLAIIIYSYLIKVNATNVFKAQVIEFLVSHLYYMNDETAEQYMRKINVNMPDFAVIVELPISQFIRNSTEWIVKNKIRSINILMCNLIQNLAINDKFNEARGLLMHSQIFELCNSGTIEEKIQYNRAVCQTGLAVFRSGNCIQTASLLADLANNSKHKEILAQNMSIRQHDRKYEQDKIDKMRIIPLHLCINLDLVDTVYNFCYMLSEVSYLRTDLRTEKQNQKNHRFRKLLETVQKSCILPETSRELIIAIAIALSDGDLDNAIKITKELKMWSLLPASTLTLIIEKMKEVALICYLQKYSKYYKSLSLVDMSNQFLLNTSTAYDLINRMIIRKELSAAWNSDAQYLHINEKYVTELQDKAMRLIVPLTIVLESNENIVAKLKNELIKTN